MSGIRNITSTQRPAASERPSTPAQPAAAAAASRNLPDNFVPRPPTGFPQPPVLSPGPATHNLVERPGRASETASQTASPNAAIPDNGKVESSITLEQDLSIEQLNVDLDIAHSYKGDLVVTLTSPSGKSAVLHERQGGSADDVKGRFDLSAFAGESTRGTWKLTVEDKAKADTGTLKRWTLNATGAPKQPPPPPAEGGKVIEKAAAPNARIEDNQTVTSTIDIADEGEISKLQLDLDIAHTYRGDLTVKLTSPSGKSVVVHNREGSGQDDVKGSFDLSAFAGEPVKGPWKLEVTDSARQDTGTLKTWGLKVTTKGEAPPPPPPPAGEPIVVVLDGGVDVKHTDLDDNLWVNPNEVAGDGKDNDGNGIADDVHGFNVGFNNGDVFKGRGTDHGTHVAGIIAAEDNAVGNTGFAAGKAKVMSIGGLYDGKDLLTNFENAVDYMVKMKQAGHNIRVVNASFGDEYRSPADVARWEAAIKKLGDHDILLVAATANGSGSNMNDVSDMPANVDQPHVLTVAAMDKKNDKLASFSSHGDKVVELAAVGENVLSTVPGNKHQTMSGTSMATPTVAAAAALVIATNPALTASQVRQILMDSVDQDTDLVGKVSTGGKLNIEKAVEAARKTLPPAPAVTDNRDWFRAV